MVSDHLSWSGEYRGQWPRQRKGNIEQGNQVTARRKQRGVTDIGNERHDLLDAHRTKPLGLRRVEREPAAG